MLIKPFHNLFLRTIDGDEGEGGGGGNEEINLGLPTEPQQTENVNPQDSNEDNKGINPAWNPVLEILPSEFHKQVIPKLTEWDQNFAKVQSQYAPYKPFLEAQVQPELIENSLQLAQLFQSDPQAVWEELGRRNGFGTVEQGQQQVDDEDEIPNLTDQEIDLTKHPQFAQMQAAYEQLNQRMEQQAQFEAERNAMAEVQNEWAALESKVGSLPPNIRAEIVNRSVMIGDRRGDGNYSLAEGYQDYVNFAQFVLNNRANNSAPDVLSGNGGLPVSKKNLGNMSDQERVDYIASYAEKLSQQNQ